MAACVMSSIAWGFSTLAETCSAKEDDDWSSKGRAHISPQIFARQPVSRASGFKNACRPRLEKITRSDKRIDCLPFLQLKDVRLFYRLQGREDLPVLVLSHSLGCDHSMWDPQMPDFLTHFRVLRYDTRGHGASDVPAGDYALDDLGNDLVQLTQMLRMEEFAFCGLSMGGAVGQWLALNHANKLSALVLANTSPQFGTRDIWEARRKAVSEGGMLAVADAVMQRFFSAQRQSSASAQSTRLVLLGTDPAGYSACCAALRDVNTKAELKKITVPTLVIGSEADPSTPWEGNGDILAREIAGAKSLVLQGAHLSNLEQPRGFTSAVLEFLLARRATK